MSLKVFITIDTEEDLWGNFQASDNPVDNINGIPDLQALFDRYGAVPTYLVNYPVATNDHAVHILKDILDRGHCEIGAHCHPWNTPPFEEEINQHNSMMCNLSVDLVMRKMEKLTDVIMRKFMITPKSFRAGRWGMGPGVARSILNLGYRVDTSVSPFINWANEDGADFRKAPTRAYRFEPDNLLREQPEGSLLEVPPTIGFFQKNFRLCHALQTILSKPPICKLHPIGIMDRLKLLNFRWLSPELSSGPDMIRLSKNFIRKGCRFLNMSFHSTSLLPGKSPFVDTEKQLEFFFKDIELFLKFVTNQDVEFLPLSQAVDSSILCGGESEFINRNNPKNRRLNYG